MGMKWLTTAPTVCLRSRMKASVWFASRGLIVEMFGSSYSICESYDGDRSNSECKAGKGTCKDILQYWLHVYALLGSDHVIKARDSPVVVIQPTLIESCEIIWQPSNFEGEDDSSLEIPVYDGIFEYACMHTMDADITIYAQIIYNFIIRPNNQYILQFHLAIRFHDLRASCTNVIPQRMLQIQPRMTMNEASWRTPETMLRTNDLARLPDIVVPQQNKPNAEHNVPKLK